MKVDNAKKIIVVMLFTTFIYSIVLVIVLFFQYQHYLNNVNNTILMLVEAKDKEEIVKILNDNNHNYQKADLSRYGINEDNSVINSMNQIFKENIVMTIIVVIILNIITTCLILIIIIRYNHKLNKLIDYIKIINNGNYTLLLENNNEDTLSKLQNELYKITVILKEDAKNMKEQQQVLKNNISDISHQIKTPMTSMSILIETLQNDDNMEVNFRKDFLKELEKQNNKIKFLVINLLKLTKFEANTIAFKQEKIKVQSLIEKVKEDLSLLLELKDIEIVSDILGEPEFIGDFKWQQEALTNIVKNCLEHSTNHKKIYISSFENAVFTKIVIKDEGDGINEKDLKHIFERFYKCQNAREDSVGIGLALAKTIIEKGGGFISVKSKLNMGTTFTIKYLK